MTDEPAERRFKIGEVCRMADLAPYVLRYWETEFPPLAPNKSGGGQRLYSRREVDIILRIKQLLYTEGFTIAGAKKKLDAELASPADAPPAQSPPDTTPPPASKAQETKTAVIRDALARVRRELSALLAMLEEPPP
jgi:DNA-binding transcriptional MerR regulator